MPVRRAIVGTCAAVLLGACSAPRWHGDDSGYEQPSASITRLSPRRRRFEFQQAVVQEPRLAATKINVRLYDSRSATVTASVGVPAIARAPMNAASELALPEGLSASASNVLSAYLTGQGPELDLDVWVRRVSVARSHQSNDLAVLLEWKLCVASGAELAADGIAVELKLPLPIHDEAEFEAFHLGALLTAFDTILANPLLRENLAQALSSPPSRPPAGVTAL